MKNSVSFIASFLVILVLSLCFMLDMNDAGLLFKFWRPPEFMHKQNLNFTLMDYIQAILNHPKFLQLPTEQKLRIFVEIYSKLDKYFE